MTHCIDCGVERWVQKSKVHVGQRCKICAIVQPVLPLTREKISATLRRKYREDGDFKRRVTAARNVKSGVEHWNWKGGITPLTQRTRTSEESNAWKLAVLHRDGYSCRLCESKESLCAHHINSWAEFPEDRHILENGLTLCKSCHSVYHNYEREVRKNSH